MQRRQLLQRSALALPTVALVGCLSPSGSTPTADSSPTASPTPSSSTAPTTSPAASPSVTSTPTPTPTNASASLQNPSFEHGLDGWTAGSDLPEDPNDDGPVDAHVTSTSRLASDGHRAVEAFIDGRQDDGTVWVAQRVDLSSHSTLAVDVHSPSESFNTITKVAAFAGPASNAAALTEADFDTTRAVEDHAGWKPYEYDVPARGDGLVAVGISVVWETEVTRYLDNVRLW